MAAPPQLETPWYTSTNPDVLLEAVRPLEKATAQFDAARERRWNVYDRRLRLFGCACARMVWDILPTDARSAVTISERYAYGNATQADVVAAAVRVTFVPVTFQQHAICAAGAASATIDLRWGGEETQDITPASPTDAGRSAAKSIATRAAGPAPGGSPVATAWQTTWNTAFADARAIQAELVRDIFPPPERVVRSLRLERGWLTSTAIELARQADAAGEYSALPVLADALQDAGCDNELILERCRATLRRGESSGTALRPGVHCRGNWVVDLLLGRE